jgi:GTP:adenosylcobinamide-phosphate guanylyltransferase
VPLTAVALAGGVLESDFRAAGYEVPNKAYLRVGDRTMLERVLSALRGAASIGRVRCVSHPDAFAATFGERAKALCDDVVAPGGGVVDSLLAGFEGLGSDELVLVAATDIPLVTPGVIDAFVALAQAQPCDVGYGFVSRNAHERRFPQVRHTWVRLREGVFCGAGVSVLRVGASSKIAALLRKVAAFRKSPLRLASLLSVGLVLKVALGFARIADIERRAGELTGLRCRGVLSDDPELAVNVDRLSDLRALETIVGGSPGPPSVSLK